MHGLIVTGISTNVGKTLTASILATALEAEYWKPIEAGGNDTETVQMLSGMKTHPPAYRFKAHLSPHHAAHLEQMQINPANIQPPTSDRLIIEGCGGVMVPYGQEHLGTLFMSWDFPWIVVSKHYLGSINHTLLTLAWLKMHRQQVLGVIFNGSPNPQTEEWILSYSNIPCLGRIHPENSFNRGKIAWYAQQFKKTLTPFGTPSPKETSTPPPPFSSVDKEVISTQQMERGISTPSPHGG